MRLKTKSFLLVSALVFYCLLQSAVAQNSQEVSDAGQSSLQTPGDSTSSAVSGTTAQSPATTLPATTLPAPSESELKQGLWRDGKAVFSDVKELDLFWKYARGYKPTQPIAFSHRIHVEMNGIECQYCHSGVNKSSYATVPALELCMGCHKLVRPEREQIKLLKKYYDEGRPVEWEPVNHLPEHAYFTHERHVKAGIGCQACHGQVQKMDVVEKLSSLKMGFCVSCHRENGASIDCQVCHQ